MVGDVEAGLALLAERLADGVPNAAALPPLRRQILERTLAGADDDRFPLGPGGSSPMSAA